MCSDFAASNRSPVNARKRTSSIFMNRKKICQPLMIILYVPIRISLTSSCLSPLAIFVERSISTSYTMSCIANVNGQRTVFDCKQVTHNVMLCAATRSINCIWKEKKNEKKKKRSKTMQMNGRFRSRSANTIILNITNSLHISFIYAQKCHPTTATVTPNVTLGS